MNVDHEISLLKGEIKRLGTVNADGKYSVKFGKIVMDDRASNLFEALVGTLKAGTLRARMRQGAQKGSAEWELTRVVCMPGGHGRRGAAAKKRKVRRSHDPAFGP